MSQLLALLHVFTTGDYLGYALTGLEEDHPVVSALHALWSVTR